MEPERAPPALVSDVLEQIFLRVASPADLARASAACVSFRGLISSPSFLRRYHAAHPPLLLGFVNREGLHPVVATYPSAAVSRGVAGTVDLSFLPNGAQGWCVYDIRDGRVVVVCRYRLPEKLDTGMERRRGFRHRWSLAEYCDVAVCDPLFRRYLRLPPITDDLFASVGLDNKEMYYSGASLIPSGGRQEEEETSFSVICWMYSKTRFVVLIFSSTSPAHWAAVKSISLGDLGLSGEDGPRATISFSGQCAYGCFYWKVDCRRDRNKFLKLDMDTMEFSKYDLPRGHQRSIAIVEAGEGKVAMFSTVGEGPVEYYTFIQSGAKKSYKWHLKNTIPLPVRGPRYFSIAHQAEGYVFLYRNVEEHDKTYLEYFSLDVKSSNIERACRTSSRILPCPYFGFPPSLSTRRIQGGHGESAWRLKGTVDRAIEF